MELPRYDLDLFMELNDSYALNGAARARSASVLRDSEEKLESSAKRVAQVDRELHFKEGMRVLEIGCGRGHLSAILRRGYGCEVVGLDIRRYPDWDDFLSEGLDLRLHDISLGRNEELGVFDRIVSLAVWEHMQHPYAALTAVKHLLRPDGGSLAYITANLHRGTKASHRYRDVFFPWPHLLFDDDVFVQFHKVTGLSDFRPAAWVNKLTVAHYEKYARQLEFNVVKQWTTGTPIDEEFYERFIDKLGRYPRYDLEQDFIYMVLGRESDGSAEAEALRTQLKESRAEAEDLARRIHAIQGSAALRIGRALVAVARDPLRVWRLPAQLWQIWRDRGVRRDDPTRNARAT